MDIRCGEEMQSMTPRYIDKKIIVYGTERQYRILKSFFDELEFSGYTDSKYELRNYNNNDFHIILCTDDKEEVYRDLYVDGMQDISFDDQLIETVNFPINEYVSGKDVYVWGTGFWCSVFERWLCDKKIDLNVKNYIDNDPEKQGSKREDIFIISPTELAEKNGIIIVATDATNYTGICKDIDSFGLDDFDVISVHIIMDDIAGDFYKVYKADYFFDTLCKNLDRNVRIRQNGIVSSCCMATPSNYGNIYYDSFEKIWNSKRARINRLSLSSRAFVFCDHNRCPFLSNVNKQEITHDAEYWIDYKEEALPESIAPEIDGSCNLRCTSCRNEIFVDNSNIRDVYTDVIIEKVLHLPVSIIINTVGEPLVSKNSMRVIEHPKMIQNGRLGLYTNGTRLTPELVDHLLEKYDTMEMSISVDAATEKTYEKIRRGGNFKNLLRNIGYISEKRKEGRVSFLQLNYVVQATNVAEMEMFAEMAERLHVDRVVMNGIENWGLFTEEEFTEHSVVGEDGIREEFAGFFTDDLKNNRIVNFYNLSHYLGLEPQIMMMI